MSKRQHIVKRKANRKPESPEAKRTIRVLVGHEIFKVSLIHPRYIPAGCGSNVYLKKREIKLASGPGYAPFAALTVALVKIEERLRMESESRPPRHVNRAAKSRK